MKKISIPFLLIAAFAALLWGRFGHQDGHLDWMARQVQADLSFFSKEDLNPERLESSYNHLSKNEGLVHFQIKENQIYWKSLSYLEGKERIRQTCNMLYKASKKRALPDVDFLLSFRDCPLEKKTNGKFQKPKYLPLFSYSKRKDQGGILFPDPISEEFARCERKKIQRAKFNPKNYWGNKKEVIFWRGDAQGGIFSIDQWHEAPRSRLALLSQYYPNDVDASFSSLTEINESVRDEMLQCLPLQNQIPYSTHLNYKYIAVADGDSCPFPQFYLALSSGSAAFKNKSPNIQWYYNALKEGEHYIEVRSDFSDLPEKVKWAKSHDKELRKISKNAENFIQNNLLPKHIYQYIVELLDEYAKLQDTRVSLLSDMNKYEGGQKTKWVKYD